MRVAHLWILSVVVSLFGTGAAAQECTSDADCGEGMTCVMTLCEACEHGEVCEPCPQVGRCVPLKDDFYVLGPECSSDEDCPYAFHCEEQGTSSDTKPCSCDCPPSSEPCECPCEDEGTDVSKKNCIWRPAKCATDTDCDPGFECREIEECWGEGCACPGCSCPPCTPDAECPPCDCPDVECTCPEVIEEHCEIVGAWCSPVEQACQSDNDCLEDWECVEHRASCMCPPCDCLEVVCSPDTECTQVPDCSCPPCECEEKKVCLPKGWKDVGYVGAGAASPEAAFSKGGGTDSDSTGTRPQPSVAQSSGSKGCRAAYITGTWTSILIILSAALFLLARKRRAI